MTALAPLMQYWRQRNARERAILTAGAAIVLLSLLYALIYEPIARERQRLQRSLPNLRADASRFSRDLALAKGSTSSAAPSDLAALAAAAGLGSDLAKISTPDSKRSQLSAHGAPWSSMTRLLADARAQGWTLTRLSARSKDGQASMDIEAEWTR
ncbi:type II secretion system protein GspM [Chitinimonas sp.]|uniref:type II secretion system protein GspM n=1 Tax=Chitinimonas sp. TaxID=1934313 RepID=UPI0035AF30B3